MARERIPVERALAAFLRSKSWTAVANEVRRKDGSKFQPNSFQQACAGLYAADQSRKRKAKRNGP